MIFISFGDFCSIPNAMDVILKLLSKFCEKNESFDNLFKRSYNYKLMSWYHSFENVFLTSPGAMAII